MTKETPERQRNLAIMASIAENPHRDEELETTFQGFVGKVEFLTSADLRVVITVPYQYRSATVPLADYYGRMLTFNVATTEPTTTGPVATFHPDTDARTHGSDLR